MPPRKRYNANIQIPIEQHIIDTLQKMAELERDTYTNMVRNRIYKMVDDFNEEYQFFAEPYSNDGTEGENG